MFRSTCASGTRDAEDVPSMATQPGGLEQGCLGHVGREQGGCVGG